MAMIRLAHLQYSLVLVARDAVRECRLFASFPTNPATISARISAPAVSTRRRKSFNSGESS